MPITATHHETQIDDSNLTVYATSSKTPTASSLQIIDVELADTNPVLAPTITGCGLTWVSMGGVEYDTAGTRHAIYRFRALGTAPTTGALAITATEAMSGCGWSWAEYDGIDTGGTNGSGAIVQTVTASGTGTTLSATLAAFASASNGVSVGLSTDADSTFTAGSGFAILGQDVSAGGAPAASIAQEWRASNDTIPDATIAVSATWGIIASELKAAPFPAVAFFLALGDDPLEAAPTWTEIPESVVERISFTSSGRSLDLEDFVGGSGSVVLRNNDGRFTPGNAASPYYPNIRLRMPFKVEATRGSDVLTIRGYVNATPVKMIDNNASVCEWPLVDAFTLFEAADAEYPWFMAIRHNQPKLWARYDELSGSVAVDYSGNGYHGIYTGSPTLQVAFGTGTGITFNGTSQDGEFPVGACITGTGDFAIEFFADFTVTGTDQFIYLQWDFATNTGVRVACLSTGALFFQTADSSGQTNVTTAVTTWASGPELHCVCRRSGTTHDITVNNNVEGTTTGTARDIPSVSIISAPGVSFAGTIDALATFQGAFTTSDVSLHYQGLLAWHAIGANGQIQYALDSYGWPATDRDLDIATTFVLGQFVPSGSVLDCIRLAAASDFGAVYMTLDGLVRFREHQAIMKTPYTTSQGTFGNGATSIPIPLESLQFDYDASRIRNDVTLKVNWQTGAIVTTPYEVAVRKLDQSSIGTYGAKTYSADILTMVVGGPSYTSILLESFAALLLARYKEPLQEVREFTLHPVEESSDALWQAVLLRQQEDRITLDITLPGGEVFAGDAHIQRIRHDIGPGKRWKTTWSISPADTQSYWVLGTSTLGVSTRLGV